MLPVVVTRSCELGGPNSEDTPPEPLQQTLTREIYSWGLGVGLGVLGGTMEQWNNHILNNNYLTL